MNSSQKATIILLAFFSLVPTGTLPAFAGGPLIVTKSGTSYVWDNRQPIPFNPDQGPLGMLDNADAVALVEEAFDAWATDAIPTASLGFVNAGFLPKDVDTVGELDQYNGKDNNGVNAIIFDADGSLFAALGLGPEVAGIAGPEFVLTKPPYFIVEGVAMINGGQIDGDPSNGEITRDKMLTVLKHEFGHFLNLDHTQINGQYFLGDIEEPGFSEYGKPSAGSVQLMFPFLFPGGATGPLSDDIATVSSLYPSPEFSGLATITGNVFESDGTTLFQGADIIARNVEDPFGDVVSNLSGARYCPDPDCPGAGAASPDLKGAYELVGLTPGASYSIEIVNINPMFTNGSSVGPLTTPRFLCGPEEFFNGQNETAFDPPDDPSNFTPILSKLR